MSARPVRVLHILQYMYGYGAERQLAQLLARVKSPDLEVGVLTVYAQSSEGKEPFDFPVTCAGRRARRDYGFIANLLSGVKAYRPDIVHTHTLSGKYWGRFAAIASGIHNIVHTEHNPCDVQQSFAQNLAGRILNRHTSRVITFFPEQGALLARKEAVEPHKLAIIPNGLDFEKMPVPDRSAARALLNVSDDDYLIMAVGRLTFQKHPDLAIRAVAALPAQQRRSTVLCFAGTGTLESELRVLAQSLDIGDRVRFLGYRSDVPILLGGADLLMMTSRYEGMPLTLIEAMHAGVPILTTPWLGSQTMLGGGEYGRIVEAADVQQLARSIAAMREDRTNVSEMALRARAYARAVYSLDKMVEAHRGLYADLAGLEAFAA